MRQMTVSVGVVSPESLDAACRAMESALKKRRWKSSAAPLVTAAMRATCKRVDIIHRGPYAFRYYDMFDLRTGKMVARLDTLYGKQITEQLR